VNFLCRYFTRQRIIFWGLLLSFLSLLSLNLYNNKFIFYFSFHRPDNLLYKPKSLNLLTQENWITLNYFFREIFKNLYCHKRNKIFQTILEFSKEQFWRVYLFILNLNLLVSCNLISHIEIPTAVHAGWYHIQHSAVETNAIAACSLYYVLIQ
jgi:hypothetical protein